MIISSSDKVAQSMIMDEQVQDMMVSLYSRSYTIFIKYRTKGKRKRKITISIFHSLTVFPDPRKEKWAKEYTAETCIKL